MRIKANLTINGSKIIVFGEITIHFIKEPQAYVTWQLFHEKNIIVSKSENYFFDKNIDTKNILIKRIIKNIEKYRVGRKKYFKMLR